MINLTFYFQFVHYSNDELLELKKLIRSNIPNCVTHLISNRDMLYKLGINNSIGRIMYICKHNVRLSDALDLFDSIKPIIEAYTQLNLFLVRINELFFNVSLAKKYLSLIVSRRFNPYNDFILINIFYLLGWTYINMYHRKLLFLSKNIDTNSMILNKIYNIDYV